MSDTQKHNKPNVPNLRFPEFSGEWKKEKLLESCNTYDGTHQTPQYTKSGIPFVSVEDVTALREVERKYISEKDFIRDYKVIPKPGDILMTRIGDIGTSMIVENDAPLAYYVSLALIRPNTINTKYLNSYIASPYFKKELYRRTIHVAFPKKINKEDIGECFISCPNKVEQEKIGNLLELINRRIAIQNKVIEKLKSLMQGMNDEMMDNPKWEKVQVGDFMEFYSTNSLSWEQLSYTDGHIKNLHYGLIHVGLQTIVDCKNTLLPYIQDCSITSKYNICKNGDVAFADASEDTAEVGKAIEFDNIGDLNIVCGLHTIHGRDVKNKTVCGFKGFAFNSKYFHNQIRRIAQGSKVFSISADNIKTCYLYIPDFAEQQKIVALLRCIQDKIEVVEQTLHFYETQKQYLLQHMFI